MTERPTWSPSPQLANATSAALASFARHWPRAMALAVDPTEDGRAYVADYARALLGCDLAAIPEAAQRWLSTNQKPPRPNEFAALARLVARELRPVQYGDSPAGPPSDAPDLPLSTQDMAHIDHRSRRAYAQLGTWRDVSEVWAMLWHSCDTAERREHVRRGSVPLDVFDDAVEMARNGFRAPSGPLSAAVHG